MLFEPGALHNGRPGWGFPTWPTGCVYILYVFVHASQHTYDRVGNMQPVQLLSSISLVKLSLCYLIDKDRVRYPEQGYTWTINLHLVFYFVLFVLLYTVGWYRVEYLPYRARVGLI